MGGRRRPHPGVLFRLRAVTQQLGPGVRWPPCCRRGQSPSVHYESLRRLCTSGYRPEDHRSCRPLCSAAFSPLAARLAAQSSGVTRLVWGASRPNGFGDVALDIEMGTPHGS